MQIQVGCLESGVWQRKFAYNFANLLEGFWVWDLGCGRFGMRMLGVVLVKLFVGWGNSALPGPYVAGRASKVVWRAFW